MVTCAVLFLTAPRNVDAQFESLDRALRNIQTAENISALAYGIVSPKEILTLQTHGFYSHAKQKKVHPDSIFRIGSISKMFTALGALVLDEKSTFSLSDPVANYLEPPPFENRWPTTSITTAMLLEHTAGFGDLSSREFDQVNALSLNEAFAVEPVSRRTRWQPGLHSSYSNSGAGVVAALIEAVSGQTFEAYMDAQIFAPLALGSATFLPPKNATKNLVRGYDQDGTTLIPYWHQLYRAFGALNISTMDMVKFTQILLNDGRHGNQQLLPEKIFQDLMQVTTGLAAQNGLSYGYAKGIYHFQRGGVTFFGHGGDADGYLAYVAISKQLKRGYFIVFNAYNNAAMSGMRKLIENELTENHEVKAPSAYVLTESVKRTLLGKYEAVTERFPTEGPRASLEVYALDDGRIFTRQDTRPPKQLIPVTGKHFRRTAQTTATAALSTFEGDIYLQGDFGNYRKID
ncbi:MAG: serine hydrolase domain-containing protein [Pseudomonadota bacterium]